MTAEKERLFVKYDLPIEPAEISIHDTSLSFTQGELYWAGRQFWFRQKWGWFSFYEYEEEVLDSEEIEEFTKEYEYGEMTHDEVGKLFEELVLPYDQRIKGEQK